MLSMRSADLCYKITLLLKYASSMPVYLIERHELIELATQEFTFTESWVAFEAAENKVIAVIVI